MLEEARFAHALGDGPVRLARARWQSRFLHQAVAEIKQGGLGQARQFPRVRHSHQRQRAEIQVGVVFDRLTRLEVFGGADAFDVGDAQRFASRVEDNPAGKPADGDQAAQARLAGLEVKDGHGILGAVADVEFATRLVKGEGVWLRSEQIRGILPRTDRFHDLVRSSVNHA